MKDFPYIRAWGKFMHSFDYYIEEQVEAARKALAPHDAIYFSAFENRWHRWSEMPEDNPNKIAVKRLASSIAAQ